MYGLRNIDFYSSIDFHSSVLIQPWSWLSTQFARSKTQTEPLLWHHSQSEQPGNVWQVDYIGSLSTKKGNSFVLIVIDTLDMDLPPLHTMLLPKLLSVELQGALSIVIVLHTALFLIKELHSQSRAVSATNGIHQSYQVPSYREAAGLITQWNDLLKTQSQC